MFCTSPFEDEEEDDDGSDQMEVIDPLSDVFSPESNLPPLKRILSMYTSESVEDRWVWFLHGSSSDFSSDWWCGLRKGGCGFAWLLWLMKGGCGFLLVVWLREWWVWFHREAGTRLVIVICCDLMWTFMDSLDTRILELVNLIFTVLLGVYCLYMKE